MTTHLAAVSLAKSQPFEVHARPTPKPGPGELLIAVKAVALNPADCLMRDQGLFIPTYPTVIGFDIAGLVLEVGENVPTSNTDQNRGPIFRPGITRVAAFAASFWRSCGPDYGAFQERCLVPWQHAVPLPDDGITWNEAATLPVSVEVPLNAWDIMGIPQLGEATVIPPPAGPDISDEVIKNKDPKREALLIWGASSSVGTMGVQTARLLRDNCNSSFAAVYATAGAANQDYVNSWARIASSITKIRRWWMRLSQPAEDGLVIRHCFLATGQLALCQAVLKAFLHAGREANGEKAKIGSAPIIPPDAQKVDGVETIFVMPSTDEKERLAQFHYWMGTWLGEKLAKGTIRPSPEPRVVGKGLEAINSGLDMLLRGVSCAKLIVEVAE